jgi:hypothetical protein
MMMSILDDDLVNVLHAERRLEAAHERVRRQLLTAPRGRAATTRAPSTGVTWLCAWMARCLSILGARAFSTPQH